MSIFLTILAVIGKILLVILAILVGIILIVLLVPIRYVVEGSAESGTIEGKGKVTWLLHLISLDIIFHKNKDEEKKIDTAFRILGINFKELRERRAKRQLEKLKEVKRKKIEEIKIQDPERYKELKEAAKQRKEAKAAEKARQEEEARKKKEAENEQLKKAKKMREKLVIRTRQQISLAQRLLQTVIGLIVRIFWLLIGGIEKAAAFPAGIVERIGKIVSKIAALCATIAKWANFAGDPRVRNAVRAVKRRMFRVLKHVFPRKISGYVHFGFEDPALTGQVLAFVSALFPLYGGKVQLDPDFSDKAIDGNLNLKGMIRLGTVGIQALLLILSRDVRYTWRTFKNLKNENEETNREMQDIKEAS